MLKITTHDARIYRSGAELVAVGCLTEALLQDVIKKESAAWRAPAKEAVSWWGMNFAGGLSPEPRLQMLSMCPQKELRC